jgi:predicted O-methyltransferase YrrM
MERKHQTRVNIQPNMSLQGATLLQCLLTMANAKYVIEIGACIGYSAIFIGEIMKKTGGKLYTIEIDERFIPEIYENILSADLFKQIEVIQGDAKVKLQELPRGADCIVLDANKPLYPKILDECVDKLKPCGFIFADDTLFRPMGMSERLSAPMDEYNKMVFERDDLINTILPVGDGITLSVKKDKNK